MDDFDLFWIDWPKKVGKIPAKKEWIKKWSKNELPNIEFIRKKLRDQKIHKEICAKEGVFCPPFPDPVRWIKYERWDDEVSYETIERVIKQSPAQRAANKRFEKGGGASVIEGECSSSTQYRVALGANAQH